MKVVKLNNSWLLLSLRRLELAPTVFAISRMGRILSSTAATESFSQMSRDSETLSGSRVEVELVSPIAAEARDPVLLKGPFSFGRAGHWASASRTVKNLRFPPAG